MALDLFQQFLLEQMLDEELVKHKLNRGEFIKKTYDSKWEGLPHYDSIDAFIVKLGEIDPTQKGIYMQWIAKLCIQNPKENKTEDLPRVGKDLKDFEEFKAKIEKKDINSYKSFQELFTAVEPFTKPKVKTAVEKKEERELAKHAKAKGEITDVYAGSEGWIKIPTTKGAAQILGQNTRWCTSAQAHNMFDHYSKSDSLFIIYDKKTKERHQLHIDSSQFANAKDVNVGIDKVPDWARPYIIEWYKKNVHGLTIKHIKALTSIGAEDIAKGTDHEEMMDLMKQYGV